MTVYRHEKPTRIKRAKPFVRDLMWCDLHGEPAWVYDDGSVKCWWEDVVEQRTDEHVLFEIDRADALTAHDSASTSTGAERWHDTASKMAGSGLPHCEIAAKRLGQEVLDLGGTA